MAKHTLKIFLKYVWPFSTLRKKGLNLCINIKVNKITSHFYKLWASDFNQFPKLRQVKKSPFLSFTYFE